MGIRVIADDAVYFLGLDLLGKGEIARVFPAYLEGENPDQVEGDAEYGADASGERDVEAIDDESTKPDARHDWV